MPSAPKVPQTITIYAAGPLVFPDARPRAASMRLSKIVSRHRATCPVPLVYPQKYKRKRPPLSTYQHSLHVLTGWARGHSYS